MRLYYRIYIGMALFIACMTSDASASLIETIVTFDNASGSLDGVVFNNQTVVFTYSYDTSNVNLWYSDSGGDDLYDVQGSNIGTVSVPGVGQETADLYYANDPTGLLNPVPYVAELDFAASNGEYIDANEGYGGALSGYQLLTNTGGQLPADLNEPLPADFYGAQSGAGLVLNSVGNVYYQAELSSVPEPASLSLIGMAALGLLHHGRIKHRVG